jgi:hypothetical protein
MSRRAVIEVGPELTVKRFAPEFKHLAAQEAAFYRLVPYACPALMEEGTDYLVLETLEPALSLPDWKPLDEMLALLTRLHLEGRVNHRDVHLGNILRHPTRGPVLIDWEHATTLVRSTSYDSHGPVASLTPQPPGQRGGPMWIGSTHPKSVGVAWR